jgi:hypothetical protein
MAISGSSGVKGIEYLYDVRINSLVRYGVDYL